MLIPQTPIATIVLSAIAGTAGAVQSNFDAGSDGWLVEDLTCFRWSVLTQFAPSWLDDDGDPGGHIGATDPSDNCYAFVAPPAYLGDQSGRYGGCLRFSLRTTIFDWAPGDFVLIEGANGVFLAAEFEDPTDEWRRFCVRITEDAWALDQVGGGSVDQSLFLETIADIVTLRISAEFGDEEGEETTFLDSVSLHAPCPADVDDDGAVTFADLLMVLSAWGPYGDCPPHRVEDVDESCVVDFGDLLVILASWGDCA